MLNKNFQIVLSLFSMFVLMIGFQNCGGSLSAGEQRRVLSSNEDVPKFEVAPDFGSNDVNIRIPDEMLDSVEGGKIEWYFIDQEDRRSDFVTTEAELNIFNANITRLSKGQVFVKLPNSSEYELLEFKIIDPTTNNGTTATANNGQPASTPRAETFRPGLPDQVIEARRLNSPAPAPTTGTAGGNSNNNNNNSGNGSSFGGGGR